MHLTAQIITTLCLNKKFTFLF